MPRTVVDGKWQPRFRIQPAASPRPGVAAILTRGLSGESFRFQSITAHRPTAADHLPPGFGADTLVVNADGRNGGSGPRGFRCLRHRGQNGTYRHPRALPGLLGAADRLLFSHFRPGARFFPVGDRVRSARQNRAAEFRVGQQHPPPAGDHRRVLPQPHRLVEEFDLVAAGQQAGTGGFRPVGRGGLLEGGFDQCECGAAAVAEFLR